MPMVPCHGSVKFRPRVMASATASANSRCITKSFQPRTLLATSGYRRYKLKAIANRTRAKGMIVSCRWNHWEGAAGSPSLRLVSGVVIDSYRPQAANLAPRDEVVVER